jgi:hypothetical protein
MSISSLALHSQIDASDCLHTCVKKKNMIIFSRLLTLLIMHRDDAGERESQSNIFKLLNAINRKIAFDMAPESVRTDRR